MKRIIAAVLAAVLLLGLSACGGEQESAARKDTTGKYILDEKRNEAIVNDAGTVAGANAGNERVFYQIFVGSFSDSNGDGIGDLRGIIDRFDYLNDGKDNSGVSLGVEGIWLTPIFLSSSYHKYNINDYYKIDPSFGTEMDLKELIELCRSRNVKLILDLPLNHTGLENKWYTEFAKAQREGDVTSKYYDFYSYADAPRSGKTYAKISGTSLYYECNFSESMPELDFDNPAVRDAVLAVAKHYLDMGIDGFRFDAAKYLYYGEEDKNTAFWDWYMTELRKIKPDVYTVAEVWDSDSVTVPYFSSTNCFNFTMAQTDGMITQTVRGGDVDALTAYVQSYIGRIQALRKDAMPVTFIANHDTDRAAGFLTVSDGKAKMGANLCLLMPGSSFIYYGEEIGMKGSRGSATTDANRRLAMLWGDGDTVKNPVGTTYAGEQVNGTVADQLPNGDSLYNHYKKLIAIRKANPAIAYGSYTALKLSISGVGGFVSEHEGSKVAVIHNASAETVEIDLARIPGMTALAAYAGMGEAKLNGTVLTVAPMTSAVVK